MKVARTDEPIRNYMDSLLGEVALLGALTGRRLTARHIHFGGGSPNLLDGLDIERLLDRIGRNFNIAADSEIAIEADPRQITAEKARIYARAGINRASLGVQDFNESTQKAINRIQPLAMVSSAVAALRDAGIEKINFDMIYGLPYQTPETMAANAFQVSALRADRVALFGYAHVPAVKPHQKNLERHGLPDARQRYEQERAARAVLCGEGYQAVGMDHFALPGDPLAQAARRGRLRRNFQGYTDDQSLAVIALGVSAISHVEGFFTQNTASFDVYSGQIAQGVVPVERGYEASAEDRLRAAVIERLMCDFYVDAGALCREHGFAEDFLDGAFRKIDPLEGAGIAEVRGRSVGIPAEGRYFVRSVCAAFDAYVQAGGTGYARAV